MPSVPSSYPHRRRPIAITTRVWFLRWNGYARTNLPEFSDLSVLTRFIRTDKETIEGTIGQVLIDILMRLDAEVVLQLDQPKVDGWLETVLLERLPVHIPAQLSWALADRERLRRVVHDQKVTKALETLVRQSSVLRSGEPFWSESTFALGHLTAKVARTGYL
jgi:hypothetical protein